MRACPPRTPSRSCTRRSWCGPRGRQGHREHRQGRAEHRSTHRSLCTPKCMPAPCFHTLRLLLLARLCKGFLSPRLLASPYAHAPTLTPPRLRCLRCPQFTSAPPPPASGLVLQEASAYDNEAARAQHAVRDAQARVDDALAHVRQALADLGAASGLLSKVGQLAGLRLCGAHVLRLPPNVRACHCHVPLACTPWHCLAGGAGGCGGGPAEGARGAAAPAAQGACPPPQLRPGCAQLLWHAEGQITPLRARTKCCSASLWTRTGRLHHPARPKNCRHAGLRAGPPALAGAFGGVAPGWLGWRTVPLGCCLLATRGGMGHCC